MTATTSSGQPPPNFPRSIEKPSSPDDLLVAHVHAKVTALQAAYLNDSATAAAALAKLRRAVHASPGTDPSVWYETLDGIPAVLLGRGDTPSAFETAIHASVTLHAIHQQSQRGRMHQLGHPLGRSIRLLTKRLDGEGANHDSPVMRRFHALATASSIPETLHHLRGLITQLRDKDIPLDYGQLARDLRRLQFPRTAPSVRLRWGRDFHRLGAQPTKTIPADGSTRDAVHDVPTTTATGDPE